LAEVARERLAPLNHVQQGCVHLLARRGPIEHFARVVPPLPAQGLEQGWSGRASQGRPKKRASPHRTTSSAGAKRVGAIGSGVPRDGNSTLLSTLALNHSALEDAGLSPDFSFGVNKERPLRPRDEPGGRATDAAPRRGLPRPRWPRRTRLAQGDQ